MMQWQTNLKMMASKERQYLQQLANYKVLFFFSTSQSYCSWFVRSLHAR
jgi:hypothetical protein